jgi:hypothetical protein
MFSEINRVTIEDTLFVMSTVSTLNPTQTEDVRVEDAEGNTWT